MPTGQSSHGRTATLLVLSVLILTVCGTIYVLVGHSTMPPPETTDIASDQEAAIATREARRLVVLLTILLGSALLILLFVVGAYLLIRVGHYVSRDRLGGHPTQYVDVWQNYRLSDEQISAFTTDDSQPPPESDDADDNQSDSDDAQPEK